MRFFSFRKFPDSSYDCNDNEEFVIHFSSNEQSYLVLYDIKLLTDHSFAICRIKVIKNTKTGQLIFFFLKAWNFFFTTVKDDFTSWHDSRRVAMTGQCTKIIADSNGFPYAKDGNIP